MIIYLTGCIVAGIIIIWLRGRYSIIPWGLCFLGILLSWVSVIMIVTAYIYNGGKND